MLKINDKLISVSKVNKRNITFGLNAVPVSASHDDWYKSSACQWNLSLYIVTIIIIWHYLSDSAVVCVCITTDSFISVKNLPFLKPVVNIPHYILYNCTLEMRLPDRSIDMLREFLWCDSAGVKIWTRNINLPKS